MLMDFSKQIDTIRMGLQGSHRPGNIIEFDLGPGKLLELKKVSFVLELSWKIVKSSLKI